MRVTMADSTPTTFPLVMSMTTLEYAAMRQAVRQILSEVEALCDTDEAYVSPKVIEYRDLLATVDEKLTNYFSAPEGLDDRL